MTPRGSPAGPSLTRVRKTNIAAGTKIEKRTRTGTGIGMGIRVGAGETLAGNGGGGAGPARGRGKQLVLIEEAETTDPEKKEGDQLHLLQGVFL